MTGLSDYIHQQLPLGNGKRIEYYPKADFEYVVGDTPAKLDLHAIRQRDKNLYRLAVIDIAGAQNEAAV